MALLQSPSEEILARWQHPAAAAAAESSHSGTIIDIPHDSDWIKANYAPLTIIIISAK